MVCGGMVDLRDLLWQWGSIFWCVNSNLVIGERMDKIYDVDENYVISCYNCDDGCYQDGDFS